jgi:hypothetical protein
MRALQGAARDPIAGGPLGRPYPVYMSGDQLVVQLADRDDGVVQRLGVH